MLPVARFLYFYIAGDGTGHIQSLVLGGALLVIGFVTFMIGLVADLIGFNRQLLEITLEKVRRIELEMGILEDGEAVPDGRVVRRESRVPASQQPGSAATLPDKG